MVITSFTCINKELITPEPMQPDHRTSQHCQFTHVVNLYPLSLHSCTTAKSSPQLFRALATPSASVARYLSNFLPLPEIAGALMEESERARACPAGLLEGLRQSNLWVRSLLCPLLLCQACSRGLQLLPGSSSSSGIPPKLHSGGIWHRPLRGLQVSTYPLVVFPQVAGEALLSCLKHRIFPFFFSYFGRLLQGCFSQLFPHCCAMFSPLLRLFPQHWVGWDWLWLAPAPVI